MFSLKLASSEEDLWFSLIPESGNPNKIAQVRIFENWMLENGIPWYTPALNLFRDYLLLDRKISPASARVYLSNVREQYRAVLRQTATRDILFRIAKQYLGTDDMLMCQGLVNELRLGIENAINPKESAVKVIKNRGDVSDYRQVRLTVDQARELLSKPSTKTLAGMRDQAIIALALSTGSRQMELANLEVDDLYDSIGGEPALNIRSGKGAVARLIPYGSMVWGRDIVIKWLKASGIDSGPVFRRVYKSGNRVGDQRLTPRSFQRIVARPDYAIEVNTRLVNVKMHDLRRSYARRLFEDGMDIYAIKDNLGHTSINVTLIYIGRLGADIRAPKRGYSFGDAEREGFE